MKPITDADGIRYIDGLKATAYQKTIDDNNVKPQINQVSYLFNKARYRLLLLANIEPNYFQKRHLYNLQDRRLLDNMFLLRIEKSKEESKSALTTADFLRYYYFKFKYRSEINKKHKWIRVTSRKDKNCIFVWHEDIDIYHATKDRND